MKPNSSNTAEEKDSLSNTDLDRSLSFLLDVGLPWKGLRPRKYYEEEWRIEQNRRKKKKAKRFEKQIS